MMAKFRFSLCLLLLVVSALLSVPALAQVAKQSNDVLSSLSFLHEKLSQGDESEPLDNARAVVDRTLQNSWDAFRIGVGPAAEWNATIDERTGLVTFAEGGNVAWIPGRGNLMTLQDLVGILKGKPLNLGAMDTIARNYMPRVQPFLGIDPSNLVLNQGRSGQPAGHLWFVDYDVVQEGMPIEGARVVFRVNNGNLIQVGTENLPAPGTKVPATRLTSDQALAVVSKYIGGFEVGDSFRDSGSLHLLPASIASTGSADGFDFGKGRGLAKVWQFVFHRDGVMGTWRARIDASTGEVLELADINEYATAQVTGGTYLNSPATGSEVVRPMPSASVSTGATTNSAGLYNFTGTAGTCALTGPYVKIADTCGAVLQGTTDSFGNIAFGTSTGTDCITPGHGGAGNTHSSREQFYQVNRIKQVVKGWLPANTWINTQLTVNVNLNQTCNAYWNGSTLNFFKSGGGCANTGQIAGVSLHEFGHGIDQNDGTGTATDGATGESYGDTTALIALHDSCLGEGFLSSNCAGYGDACTACTGVRDADFARHASNTPATPDNFIRVHCPAAGLGAGKGPCGKEVHCESYVPTETMWDLAARDLPSPGTGIAWTILDRLWYLSRNTATKSFTCTSGTTYTSNGCSAGSLWKVMRAVDDDDGNLNNGTPHGGALFAAFNRHSIACTTDAGASTTFAGCTPPAAPALTITPGDNLASLAWTAVGSSTYDVFRNETGCNAGFTKIASGTTATTLADSDVGNGLTYYYQVTAFPTGNESCASTPSTCVAVSPATGPCVPPAAPASLTATAGAGSVALSWAAVTGAAEYHVLRSAATGGPYTQVGVASGTTFTDSGLTGGTTYFYVVRAANSATCESGNSPEASATPTASPGDFTLSISPSSVTVPLFGTTATYTVTVNRTGGFTSPVSLSVTGLPTGATATFSPNPATGSSSTLTVKVKITPRGTFTLTVTGTGGSPVITRTATATLIKN
jgi:trimeric autotransporter adhesin